MEINESKWLKPLDLSIYNLEDIKDVKDAWNKNKDYVNNFLYAQFVHPEQEELESLQLSGFRIRDLSRIKNYCFHPCLVVDVEYMINEHKIPNVSNWYMFLIKAAMLENIENKESTKTLSKFIYQYDKDCNRSAREINNTGILDRFDTFRCGIIQNKIIRHYGTIHGAETYSNLPANKERKNKLGLEKSSQNRSANKEFLKTLIYGPSIENEYRKLICAVSGNTVEGKNTRNYNTGELVQSDNFQVHHAKYDAAGSFYKSASPSEYLNDKNFTQLSQEVIDEFLGCIILDVNSHDTLHKTHKFDGIDNWIKRFTMGDCIMIPYHWRSEENYELTKSWLEEKCENYKSYDSLCYKDFIARHNSKRPRTENEQVQKNIKD